MFVKSVIMPMNEKIRKIAVLGGGIGGTVTALKLAELPNVEVHIFEKKNDLLLGSSNITPGRMGLGFHYRHVPTALKYLKATIEWVKEFKKMCPDNLRIGEREAESHYLRRGRYFVVKNSQVPLDEILQVYDAIKAEYKRLVDEDPTNEVFGSPENFYRILSKEEYENDVNMVQVIAGIETPEHLLDWPNFKKALLNKIADTKNIYVHCQMPVIDIGYNYEQSQYLVDIGVGKEKFSADIIVNATWEHVDFFNSKAGFIRPKIKKQIETPEGEIIENDLNVRTNRVKVLAKVKLPDAIKERNSMFFCMGPHCMFSNMGDGTALMSYAPVTNIENSTDLMPSEKYFAYLKGNIDTEEKNEFGHKIIVGVSKYIPAMKDAELLEVRFGTVQTEGDVNVFSHDSKVHERDYDGVNEMEVGFIANACMKLLYGLENAKKIAEMVKDHFDLIEKINTVTEKFIEGNKMLQGIVFSFFRKVNTKDLSNENIRKVVEAHITKGKLNKEINFENPEAFFSVKHIQQEKIYHHDNNGGSRFSCSPNGKKFTISMTA